MLRFVPRPLWERAQILRLAERAQLRRLDDPRLCARLFGLMACVNLSHSESEAQHIKNSRRDILKFARMFLRKSYGPTLLFDLSGFVVTHRAAQRGRWRARAIA